jgi:hypothetical protein
MKEIRFSRDLGRIFLAMLNVWIIRYVGDAQEFSGRAVRKTAKTEIDITDLKFCSQNVESEAGVLSSKLSSSVGTEYQLVGHKRIYTVSGRGYQH